MADLGEGGDGGGGGHHKGKKRAKKGSTRVDMTPMVDLAFLLLTFFVLTSQFSKPKVMSLVYPAKQVDNPKPPEKINNAYTFLLSEDRIFYYEGAFKKGETQLIETDFGPKGVRKLLSDGNIYVIREHERLNKEFAAGKLTEAQVKEKLGEAQKHPTKSLKALIKTDVKATCKNFIDLIDELKINDIGMIAPVDMNKSEEDLLIEKLK